MRRLTGGRHMRRTTRMVRTPTCDVSHKEIGGLTCERKADLARCEWHKPDSAQFNSTIGADHGDGTWRLSNFYRKRVIRDSSIWLCRIG